MNWYLRVLKNYAVFNGRARRQEYWYFTLFSAIIYLALSILETLIGLGVMGALGILYTLAVLVPTIAVTIRRLHDTNRSGWWMWIGLVPLIGAVALLVFTALDSNPGENKYGPSPKEALE